LFNLTCPGTLIGAVEVYEVKHHGGGGQRQCAIFAAFATRVAIMNNGLKKGGALGTYEDLHHVRGLGGRLADALVGAAGENLRNSPLTDRQSREEHPIGNSAPRKTAPFACLNRTKLRVERCYSARTKAQNEPSVWGVLESVAADDAWRGFANRSPLVSAPAFASCCRISPTLVAVGRPRGRTVARANHKRSIAIG